MSLFSLSLLAKLLVSAGMVITITLVAEHVSTRFAGVLMGFPLGAGLSLFFIGIEQGPQFAASSALWSAQGINAALGFCVGYFVGVKLSAGGKAREITISVVLGLVAFFISASVMRYFLPAGFFLRLLLLFFFYAVCTAFFRRIEIHSVARKVRFTPLLLACRALFSAGVIVIVTGVAGIVGEEWSGLFATFPTTVLPSVVVLHYHYGSGPVLAMFRGFPFGLLAIVVFSFAVYASFPLIGTLPGIVVSYGVAALYLLLYELKLRRMFEKILPIKA